MNEVANKICLSLPAGMLNMKEVISSYRLEPTNKKLNMKEVIRFQNSNGFQTPASKFPVHSQMTKTLIRFQKNRSLSFMVLFHRPIFPALCLMNQLLHDSNSIFPHSFIHDSIETKSKVCDGTTVVEPLKIDCDGGS
ncbi:hypothetical protein HanPSC8_Chr13g0548091 [Helianthus annuus]|nr:hypothetical protein HanPSC8_Chr13g0548091 [Helianthus annuus]